VGIVLLVVVIVALVVVLPLLVAVVDVVVLLLLAVGSTVARVVFRRPWIVEARADDGRTGTWKVVGWKASGKRLDAVADGIERGVMPTNAAG
jgi:hypothetical protein